MSIKKFIKEEMESELEAAQDVNNQHTISRDSLDFDIANHSMICCGCSCMCDDISFFLENGKIVRTLNLCEVAMKRLRTVQSETRLKVPENNEFDEKINKAVDIIKNNGPCLILGSDGMGESVIQASLRFADKVQGIVLPWLYPDINKFYNIADNFGWPSALLDEVRDCADLVFMWRCDPLDTHHRHLSRYSLFARGRYTERGHSDRNFVGIADKKPFFEPLCQQYFEFEKEKDVQFILASLNPPQAKAPEHRDFPLLLNALQRATYIAFFIDPSNMTLEALETLFEWSEKTNNFSQKRMVILPLWPGGANISCFTQSCLDRYGTPEGADFTKNNIMTSSQNWEDIAQETGSIIIFESGPNLGHRQALPSSLADKPKIIITPFKENSETDSDVLFPAALPGIETQDIFFRSDGIPLNAKQLEGLKTDNYPEAEYIIHELLTRLES